MMTIAAAVVDTWIGATVVVVAVVVDDVVAS